MRMNLMWLVLIATAGLCAQQTSKLTARELFYRENTADAPKPQPKPGPVRPPVKPKLPDPVAQTPHTTPSGVPVVNAAAHLGLRYVVLQVTDREAKKRKPVDPDTSFRPGDCVAIALEPNRNGYLYVFNRGTTGAWQPLLPSPDMPNERNRILNGKPLLVPSEHCFEFDGNAGTERLLIVITEKEEDARRLSEAMRTPAAESPTPTKGPTLLAGGPLMRQLETLREGQMIGRDIKIAKIGPVSTGEGEQPNSVYAVRTSAGAADRLVIEIPLRHE